MARIYHRERQAFGIILLVLPLQMIPKANTQAPESTASDLLGWEHLTLRAQDDKIR